MMKVKVSSRGLLIVAGLMLVPVFTAMGDDPAGVRLVVLPEKKVMVETNELQQQAAKVEITDLSNSEIVYDATLPENSPHKVVYNLSELPEGNYEMTVKTENKVYQNDLQIEPDKAMLVKESVYTQPVFRDGEGKLGVTFTNKSHDPVTVRFSDNEEDFFTDKIPIRTSFTRTYNLGSLPAGDYNVEFSVGPRTYYHAVHIQ
jgi:hypothetical protein